ncbi:MAG TPA: elongation factor G [Acidimicrobiales bacterium]|nr:elongation factor G [Acidimicrobiales bacterium]
MAPSLIHPKARTVALVGRSGVGKTSLLEALVVATGGLERPGSVTDGTTLCGNDPEERKHQMSLGIAMAPVWVGEDKMTLLDTPGFVDFHGEVARALDVADVAVLVVGAVEGVTNETVLAWNLVRDADVPAVVFVNSLDAERANFEATLGALEQLIGPTLAPLELPIGEGEEFSGVVDLLADTAITYADSTVQRAPVPEGLATLESRVRASLLEAIVVGDDALTERYLEGEEPAMEELEAVLGGLMTSGRIVPVALGSVTRAIGIDRLATLLDEIAESRQIRVMEAGTEILLARDPDAEPVLRAFKVIVDPYVGRIVVMEVIAGTVRADMTLTNVRTKSEERLHGLNFLFGSKLMPVQKAYAGDVVAVAKLNNVVVGDLLAGNGRNLSVAPPPEDAPALSLVVRSSSRDIDKVATALHRLSEEDPSLSLRHDPVSREILIDLMGDVHLQVVLERLRRRFNVDITTEVPPVQLFETITAPREVEGRLKKQTGGHGQYAVVNLRVEPIEPTAPLEFVDAIVGGAVPHQYIGAVRRGIEKAMEHGGPAGHRVVGLRVTLFDGKYHSVDSSEAAFETAASLGLRSALESSGTMVLERIMAVDATVPTPNQGEVLNDLSGRRGRVIGTNQVDETFVTISANVPEAELHRYGLDLRNMTGGRGRAHVEEHHLAEASRALTR